MKIVGKVTEMTREEWLESRRKGIGGSDAAAILGLSKWKSPFELYIDKTEGAPDINSEIMYWGNVLEDVVAQEFTKRTGKKVRRNNHMLQSNEYPWMVANLDREIVGEDAILECKTTSAYNSKQWEDDQIPANYILQVQHYLAVTGKNKGYIAVLIGGQKFAYKEIPRDEELIQILIEAERDFWLNHVEKGIPPALDGSSAAEKYLKEKYENAEPGTSIDLKSEYSTKIDDLFVIKEKIKELEEQATEIENNIKNELGEIETGFTPKYVITWKPVITNRLDTKALKKDLPEISDKYTKPSASRRFTIKELKEG